MNLFKRIYCRVFQTCMRVAIPLLPYREPQLLNEINQIPGELKKLNVSCVLLVTDRFLSQTEVFLSLKEQITKSGINCAVFNGVCANPTVNNVEKGVEIYNENNCNAIIAFGGGSPIDCSKGIGARIAYPKKCLNKLKGLLKVLRKTPPVFAVPTTAGTGSECTLAAVITDSELKHKYTMNSFALIPSYAVLDATVTYSLPPHLTATTGIDALTHAVEAFIGRSTTKKTREQATQATKLIFENITVAYSNPTNHTARSNMLKAAYLAGLAFSKSYVGYVHAVAHSLGGMYNTAHGLANSILLPVVLRAYGKKVYKKLYKLALSCNLTTKEESVESGAEKFIQKIESLLEELNVPKTLPEIREEDIPTMAKYADKEANPLYPVPVLMNDKELSYFYKQISGKKD